PRPAPGRRLAKALGFARRGRLPCRARDLRQVTHELFALGDLGVEERLPVLARIRPGDAHVLPYLVNEPAQVGDGSTEIDLEIVGCGHLRASFSTSLQVPG